MLYQIKRGCRIYLWQNPSARGRGLPPLSAEGEEDDLLLELETDKKAGFTSYVLLRTLKVGWANTNTSNSKVTKL